MRKFFQPLAVIVSVGFAVWMLPIAVDSMVIAVTLIAMLVIGIIFGWLSKSWLLAMLIVCYIVIADLFGLARAFPGFLWLVIGSLWVLGTWVIGHIGTHQSRIFHQALASFLVVEVFLVLFLWPINILSKSVIAVAFLFFLWNEFVRSVSGRQRIQESLLPFFLIVTLMMLTGHWFSW